MILLRSTAPWLARTLLLALAACSSERAEWPTPPGGDTTGTPGTGTPGSVQRASLTVTVQPEAADSLVTGALGWRGAVPGAMVVIQRAGSAAMQSATADAGGIARFTDLLPGDYTISVLRQLHAEEMARLATDDRDVAAFGGGVKATLTAPGLTRTVSAAAGRRGSLVFSEMWGDKPQQPSGEYYYFSNFLELYNNSDTTVALASKLIVVTYGGEDSPLQPCSRYTTFRGDPEGIWAGLLYRFPPSARSLGPGELAVIATDALDHTVLARETFNLSSADFEFRGGADADNPDVPDMLSVGGRDGSFIQGHGYYPNHYFEVLALVDSVDVSTLPSQMHPALNVPFVRVPTGRVLDVLYWRSRGGSTEYPECAESPVPAALERQRNEALERSDSRSLHRAVAYTLPNGRKVLLRTRTSARDFVAASPTPFTLP